MRDPEPVLQKGNLTELLGLFDHVLGQRLQGGELGQFILLGADVGLGARGLLVDHELAEVGLDLFGELQVVFLLLLCGSYDGGQIRTPPIFEQMSRFVSLTH